jgi:DNA-binding transcriptional LysR family regulator
MRLPRGGAPGTYLLPLLLGEFRHDTLVLIRDREHPLTDKDPMDPADLGGEPFVLREAGSSTRAVLERAFRERGLQPRVVMELGSTEAIKKPVAAGLGVSFVSRYAVERENRTSS